MSRLFDLARGRYQFSRGNAIAHWSHLIVSSVSVLIIGFGLSIYFLAVPVAIARAFDPATEVSFTVLMATFISVPFILLVIFYYSVIIDTTILKNLLSRPKRLEKIIERKGLKSLEEPRLQELARSILARLEPGNLGISHQMTSGPTVLSDVYLDIGKNRLTPEIAQIRMYLSVASVRLSRSVPDLYFDSRALDINLVQWLIKPDQQDQLEADFYRYFRVYSPSGYHVDLRSIVSPDVMEALISLSNYDIQLAGDRLYIYDTMHLDEKRGILNEIDKVVNLAKLLERNLNTYRDSRVEGRSNRGGVHRDGYRLRLRNKFLFRTIAYFVVATVLYVGFFVVGSVIQ